MRYYRVRAEHVRQLAIGLAAEQMEEIPGVILMAAGADGVFDRQAIWVLASELALGNQLQDIVWRYNGGNWCEVAEIDEETAEGFC